MIPPTGGGVGTKSKAAGYASTGDLPRGPMMRTNSADGRMTPQSQYNKLPSLKDS